MSGLLQNNESVVRLVGQSRDLLAHESGTYVVPTEAIVPGLMNVIERLRRSSLVSLLRDFYESHPASGAIGFANLRQEHENALRESGVLTPKEILGQLRLSFPFALIWSNYFEEDNEPVPIRLDLALPTRQFPDGGLHVFSTSMLALSLGRRSEVLSPLHHQGRVFNRAISSNDRAVMTLK